MLTQIAALLLVLVAFALPASAQGYKGFPTIIDAVGVSSTQTSEIQASVTGSRFGWLTLVVSACDTCNITLTIEVQDPGSEAWFTYGQVAAAATGTGTQRLWLGDSTVSTNTGFTTSLTRPFPDRWRASVVWTSGTSASYQVHAVTF